MEIAGILVVRSGLRYGPLAAVAGDNVLVMGASRGERELPRVAALDFSIAKVLRLGRLQARIAVEVLNAGNAQPMIWVNNVGAAATPGNHLQPRTFQFVARLGF
jgi:hypothetical protein